MAKYILIEANPAIDQNQGEFDDLREAIDAADDIWRGLNWRAKLDKGLVYVLESADPDPDSDEHYDGNPVYYPSWSDYEKYKRGLWTSGTDPDPNNMLDENGYADDYLREFVRIANDDDLVPTWDCIEPENWTKALYIMGKVESPDSDWTLEGLGFGDPGDIVCAADLYLKAKEASANA